MCMTTLAAEFSSLKRAWLLCCLDGVGQDWVDGVPGAIDPSRTTESPRVFGGETPVVPSDRARQTANQRWTLSSRHQLIGKLSNATSKSWFNLDQFHLWISLDVGLVARGSYKSFLVRRRASNKLRLLPKFYAGSPRFFLIPIHVGS